MKRHSIFSLLVLAVVLSAASCSKVATPSVVAPYNEDLGSFREALASFEEPKKEVPKETVTTPTTIPIPKGAPPTSDAIAVDSLLARLSRQNARFKALSGYRIQLFTGSDSDRANEIRNKASYTLSAYGLRPEIVYEEPLFKVKAGYFISQLEAQRTLAAIKKHFSEAILVPDKINMELIRAKYKLHTDEE